MLHPDWDPIPACDLYLTDSISMVLFWVKGSLAVQQFSLLGFIFVCWT
jgi:hypothetical protein